MNYQLADGPGFVNDEGELRPGVNLFAWRDLLKRTAVLQHELGLKSTMIWTHMTNVRKYKVGVLAGEIDLLRLL